MQNGTITAQAEAGRGGDISIRAEALIDDPQSLITASSRIGIDGVVEIDTPVSNLSRVVTPLPRRFSRVTKLLRHRCAERLREGRVSSLVVGGYDAMPVTPSHLLPSRLIRRPSTPTVAPPPGAQSKVPSPRDTDCLAYRASR